MLKNKKYPLLMILSVLFMVINPADASGQDSNENLRNKVRLGVGLSIGIGLTVAHGILLFGSMIGLIPGAVMAPCIRIFLPEQ